VKGRKKALAVSIFVHAITLALVLFAGLAGKSGMFFWTGATIFMLLLIYQHSIVGPDDLRKVTMAFATTNGIASIIFAFFIILDLILRSH
jgi:4-hydroxybenzoate polyprenyltransferase